MLYWLLSLPVLFYLALLAFVYFFQDRLLFINTKEIYRTPEVNKWRYEDVTLDVSGGTTHAWYIYATTDPRGVILFSHGNAGNIADRLESVSMFRDLGFDVLVYDYGGYGKSTGKPSEKRCYEDIRAMWRFLTENRGFNPEAIVLLGRSLGAGPTTQLATEVQAGAVVIESAFRSVPTMAKDLYRVIPANLLIRHRFDNESKIAHIHGPLLVVHSPQDETIPFAHGKRLFELASEPKEFLQIQGAHNEGFWKSGALYTEGLNQFLQVFSPKGAPHTSPGQRPGNSNAHTIKP